MTQGLAHTVDGVGVEVPRLRLLDLFSGIGGFSLGLERSGGFETVAFCEIEPFCRRVLAKHWPGVPIYDDVRPITAERLAADGVGGIDAICGGFPCQDISDQGKRAGLGGERSGLWSELARIAGEIRPRYVIVENVSALLSLGMDRVLGDLAAIGFDAEWHCIPAGYIGAPHERDRLWIIAYPAQEPGLHQSHFGQAAKRLRYDSDPWRAHPWDEANPRVCGVEDGVPDRVERTEALGNAVVPQIPELIGRAILTAMAPHPSPDPSNGLPPNPNEGQPK